MRLPIALAVASLSSVALAAPAPASPTATDVADVYAAQATALTLSPTSRVKGKAFDRYVSIWFENTDYETAAADHFSAQLGVRQWKLMPLFLFTMSPACICTITNK
jgi:hypothetical protein